MECFCPSPANESCLGLGTQWQRTGYPGHGDPLASISVGHLLGLWLKSPEGPSGMAAAFAMSFVVFDLLYYGQHRWFHGPGWFCIGPTMAPDDWGMGLCAHR